MCSFTRYFLEGLAIAKVKRISKNRCDGPLINLGVAEVGNDLYCTLGWILRANGIGRVEC